MDVYFGPKPPAGHEGNWEQTWPDKGWFVMLRLYGPLQPWFDKTWRPGEIERVKRGFAGASVCPISGVATGDCFWPVAD